MTANLTHICLFTDDVQRLAKFYGAVLEKPVPSEDTMYLEFNFESGAILSIYHIDGQNELAPGSAAVRHNKSSILEFNVKDVDAEYGRLTEFGVDWVKPPTTQGWGNRSIYTSMIQMAIS